MEAKTEVDEVSYMLSQDIKQVRTKLTLIYEYCDIVETQNVL